MLYTNCIQNETTKNINWMTIGRELKEVLKGTKQNGLVARIRTVMYDMEKGYVRTVVKVKAPEGIKAELIKQLRKDIPECLVLTDEQVIKIGSRFSWLYKDTPVEFVEPGTYKGKKCDGTYFGSGGVSYKMDTNGQVEDDGQVDNGFCVVEYYKVTLEPGQFLIQDNYCSPGGSNGHKLMVCK